jgi:hypothetical protein
MTKVLALVAAVGSVVVLRKKVAALLTRISGTWVGESK